MNPRVSGMEYANEAGASGGFSPGLPSAELNLASHPAGVRQYTGVLCSHRSATETAGTATAVTRQ